MLKSDVRRLGSKISSKKKLLLYIILTLNASNKPIIAV